MKSKAIITQNFWQELQERGFLLDLYRDADRLAKPGDHLELKTDGRAGLIDGDGQAVAAFVNENVFIQAIHQTEEIVKYKLFVNQ